MSMSDLHPDKIGYYGKPVSSLMKDELLQAVLELSEIIHNCQYANRPARCKPNKIL